MSLIPLKAFGNRPTEGKDVAISVRDGAVSVTLSTMFKALGDPARLKIFEFLCATNCCPMAVSESGEVRPVIGVTVGEVCCSITGEERITSTISQQLKQLRQAGLITVERRGKNMICRVNEEALQLLGGYLDQCKIGNVGVNCCR